MPGLSAQQNLSGIGRRLLALLSLAAAATLLLASTGSAGRSGLQNACSPDRILLSGLGGLVEEAQRQPPDGAAGGTPAKARRPDASALATLQPDTGALAPVGSFGAPRTHAARAGLTRAPPRA